MSPLTLTSLRRALAGSIPGEHTAPEGRSAAVAAILRDGAEGLEVLFIQRAEREGDPWSGHMAFPGGRREPVDPHLYATALRETREEIGLELGEHAELLGVLEDHDATGRGTRGALPTRPFVFALHGSPSLSLSDEVSELVWAPVAPLYRDEPRTSVTVPYQGQSYTLPGWHVQGRTVWGLTYRMMSVLFDQLRPR